MLNDVNMNNNRLIAGQSQMPKLSKDEIKGVIDSYMKMFRALTYQNLLNGQTLGKSWHDAGKQMESFVAGKDEFNPAAKQLNDILASHKKDIAKMSMTHPNRDMVIQIPQQQREQLQKRVSAELKSGQDGVNKIIAKYQPVAEKARTEMKKLEMEKAKLAEKQQAQQQTQKKVTEKMSVESKRAPENKNPEKVNKFANATKKLDAMAMEQMKIKLMLALQQQNQRRAA